MGIIHPPEELFSKTLEKFEERAQGGDPKARQHAKILHNFRYAVEKGNLTDAFALCEQVYLAMLPPVRTGDDGKYPVEMPIVPPEVAQALGREDLLHKDKKGDYKQKTMADCMPDEVKGSYKAELAKRIKRIDADKPAVVTLEQINEKFNEIRRKYPAGTPVTELKEKTARSLGVHRSKVDDGLPPAKRGRPRKAEPGQ